MKTHADLDQWDSEKQTWTGTKTNLVELLPSGFSSLPHDFGQLPSLIPQPFYLEKIEEILSFVILWFSIQNAATDDKISIYISRTFSPCFFFTTVTWSARTFITWAWPVMSHLPSSVSSSHPKGNHLEQFPYLALPVVTILTLIMCLRYVSLINPRHYLVALYHLLLWKGRTTDSADVADSLRVNRPHSLWIWCEGRALASKESRGLNISTGHNTGQEGICFN